MKFNVLYAVINSKSNSNSNILVDKNLITMKNILYKILLYIIYFSYCINYLKEYNSCK